jgi:hypothetical protein
MKIEKIHSGIPFYHILKVLQTFWRQGLLSNFVSDSSKYILIVFLFCKSKERLIGYTKYLQFKAIHLKVYNIPITTKVLIDCRNLL